MSYLNHQKPQEPWIDVRWYAGSHNELLKVRQCIPIILNRKHFLMSNYLDNLAGFHGIAKEG